jgi:hypothetical protein
MERETMKERCCVCGFRVRKAGTYSGFEVLFTTNPKKNIGPKKTEPHQTPPLIVFLKKNS